MGQINRLEVIDREGWRHDFALEKAVVHVGGDSRNDIILDSTRGGNVAPLHAQLILSILSGERPAARAQLVNLADTDIALGSANGDMLPPRSATELVDGMSFRIGDFTLIFHGVDMASGPVEMGGQNIGLSLHLPRTRLEPNRFIDGVVRVRNGGDRGGAQIELRLEGLPDTAYDLEPGPMLSSGADREVLLRIYHRGHLPLAGSHRITVRAAAPKVYPGDEATASVKIDVVPQYSFSMRLLAPEKSLPACVHVLKPQIADLEAPVKQAEIRPPLLEEPAAQPPLSTPRASREHLETDGEDWWAPTAAPNVPSKLTEGKPAATTLESPLPREVLVPQAEQGPAVAPAAADVIAEPTTPDVEVVSGESAMEVTDDLLSDAPGGEVPPVIDQAPPPLTTVTTATGIKESLVSVVEEPPEDKSASADEATPPPLLADSVEVQPPMSATDEPQQEATISDPAQTSVPVASAYPRPVEIPEGEGETPTGTEQYPEKTPPVTARQPSPVAPSPAPTDVDVDPSTVDVWWQTTASRYDAGEESSSDRGVIRLKAAKPQEMKDDTPTEPPSEVPPQAWWIPEAETDLTPPSEGPVAGQPVLRMKAEKPSAEGLVSQTVQENPPARAGGEDWWSPSTDTEENQDA